MSDTLETTRDVDVRIAEIRARREASTIRTVLMLAKVEGEEFASCFQTEHWDLCFQFGAATETPDGASIEFDVANLGCFAGDEGDAVFFQNAAQDVDYLLAQLKTERGKVRDLARDMARVAHWLLNDRGWTRAMAARDLANTARKAWPVELEILGDAASLVVGEPIPQPQEKA